MKRTLVTITVLLMASAGRSACTQTAYASDYDWPVEQRLAETWPAETWPAETWPAETWPVEPRPVETWPVETLPVDMRFQRLPPLADEPSLELPPELAEADVQPDAEPPDAEASEDLVEMAELAEEAPPVKLWKGSFELGFNGSEGNTETLNFRFGIDAKRKTKANIIDLDIDYHKKTADNVETANRMFFDGRYEWLNGDSPWTSFAHQTTEFDEFKAYNSRVTLDFGVGYQFLDNDATSLMARLGSGVSNEIGGPDNSVVPEMTCGLEFEHQLSASIGIRHHLPLSPP
jgi:hypothetical protein